MSFDITGIIVPKDELERDDAVAKAYFDTVRELQLPMTNVNNVKAKIKQLEQEVGKEPAVRYLNFLKTHWNDIDLPYKPQLNESLDIYRKRMQIYNCMKNATGVKGSPIG